jgi:hypothetical protein
MDIGKAFGSLLLRNTGFYPDLPQTLSLGNLDNLDRRLNRVK